MTMLIRITKTSENATPIVINALNEIKNAGGGELHFEKGEYHFYKEGTLKKFFAVSNNSACDKYMVFPLIDMENVVIDGNGSHFVFHDVVFPFMISHSKNISIRNMILDTAASPLVEFKIHGKTPDGFYMDIDRSINPFFVEDGSLCFNRESNIVSGKNEFFSLHAVGCHKVQYFATGECSANMTNLPAPLMKCTVTETETGIYAKYCCDNPDECRFGEERVTAIVDGKRDVDVICLDNSREIEISSITVARGIGMGIIGQLSENICIDGFSTDISFHKGALQTLTADSLHFVNCMGKLEIKNCNISDTMDDVLNSHGMYTVVQEVCHNTLCAMIMHREQLSFNPYRQGNRLVVIDNTTFETVAEFIVDSSSFKEGSNQSLVVKGHFNYGADSVREGFWVENPDCMPDVHLHHNRFCNFPHIRLSGGGEILVENNYIAECEAALLCLDLARFWYESGRVEHLVYRNNTLDNCNASGKEEFIRIGIDGIEDGKAPKIHNKIEITGNEFIKIKKYAVRAAGVKELVFENNSFDKEYENIVELS